MNVEQFLEGIIERAALKPGHKKMIDFLAKNYEAASKQLSTTPVTTTNEKLTTVLSSSQVFLAEAVYFLNTMGRPETMNDTDFKRLKPLAEKLVKKGEWDKKVLDLFD